VILSQKRPLFCIVLSSSLFLSCKTRNMNEGASKSSSTVDALEICGNVIFEKINSDKSALIYLRTDWKTATKISEAFHMGRDSTRRLVEVSFPPGSPAPLKRDVQDARKKVACMRGEFTRKRIVARSFTLRDSRLEEQEVTACGDVFEEDGLFGIHLPSDSARSPVLVVGRNTKKNRQLLGSLAGKSACVRGNPFLAQERLAFLSSVNMPIPKPIAS